MSCSSIEKLLLSIYFLGSFSFGLQANNMYEHMAEENLKSLPQIAEAEKPISEEEKKKDFKKFMQVILDKQLNLQPYQKRKMAFELLKVNAGELSDASGKIDFLTYQDLEIFCGGKKNPQIYLADKLCKTETELGRVTLYKELLKCKSIEQIKKNQEFIKILLENDALFEQLTEQLKMVAEVENALFSFWNDEHILSFLKEKDIVTEGAPLFFKKFLNENSIGIELRSIFSYPMNSLHNVFAALVGFPFMLFSIDALRVILSSQKPSLSIGFLSMCLSLVGKGNISLLPLENEISSNPRAILFFSLFQSGLIGYKFVLDAVTNFNSKKFVQFICLNKLRLLSRYFSSLEDLKNSLGAVQASEISIQLSDQLNTGEISSEVKDLTSILKKSTFKKGPSFFPFTGRMISAYRKMEKNKESLGTALEAVGKLDVYVSLARLMRESKNSPVKFCFPDFVDPETVESPVVEIENFWHPVLDSKNSVSNTIALGNDQPQTAIVTGPNAGGKSTITKAMVVSIIVAQTLGIAPAEKMRFTPFTRIITSLNIVDDTAGGDSFFKAAARRSKEIWGAVSSLTAHQFSFTALDELFNGTNHEAAQAAACSFIERLASLGSNICVAPTHFIKVTELAEKDSTKFVNYMTPISRDEQGKVVYTYKLQPGVNKDIITFEVMNDMGADAEFLHNAQANFNNFRTKS